MSQEIVKEFNLLIDSSLKGKIKQSDFENESKRIIQTYTQHPLFKKIYIGILMKELIALYKNTVGQAAENIQSIYLSHDFPKYSLNKLNNWRWYIKAKGIKELSDMDFTDASKEIMQFINHENPMLRTEAQTALVKLSNFDALRFLNETQYPISEWQQMKFLNILSDKEVSSLPDFSQWLHSSNETVVIFSLKLIRHFLSIKDSSAVEKILTHHSLKVRIEAVETIGVLHDENALSLIKSQFYGDVKEFKTQALKCFMGIFKSKDFSFLEVQMLSDDYDISLAATKAIAFAGDEGKLFLKKINESYADDATQQIIKHALAVTN